MNIVTHTHTHAVGLAECSGCKQLSKMSADFDQPSECVTVVCVCVKEIAKNSAFLGGFEHVQQLLIDFSRLEADHSLLRRY